MVRPLEYHSNLSLEEAEKRYEEIIQEFETVKGHYAGLFSRFKRKMSEGDKKTLGECVGVLLPLNHEASVQQEIVGKEPQKEALFYKLGRLEQDIMMYAARFKNTGIKVFKTSATL